MAGDGKRRSEWNTLLLADVIAPIYAKLIVRARGLLGPQGRRYLDLLPAVDTQRPWSIAVASMFALLRDLPVLYSESGRGGWIAPSKAEGVLEGEEAEEKHRLYEVLLLDGVPVVHLPPDLLKAMLRHSCLKAEANPDFVRSHFRRTDIQHPCLEKGPGRENALFLLSVAAAGLGSDSLSELVGLPFLPLADGTLGRIGSAPPTRE
ncbi:unnamed protein product, partial [Discosporangium mesarthrocarpum]